VTNISPGSELVMVGRKQAPSCWIAQFRKDSAKYEEIEVNLESMILIFFNFFY